jgi:hypothetical protein
MVGVSVQKTIMDRSWRGVSQALRCARAAGGEVRTSWQCRAFLTSGSSAQPPGRAGGPV